LALRRDIFSHHLSRWISPRNEMGNCLQHRLRRRRQDRLIAPSLCPARKGVISGNRSQR
jgi:hypothetical protein